MAYDPKLATRVRQIVVGHDGVTEKAMFGGLAYLLHGKMFCGVLGEELLARVGPEAHDTAMARPGVRVMDFTGKPMRGYVFVGPAALVTKAGLTRWVKECERHAASLPDKPKRKAKPARAGGSNAPATKARRRPATASRRA